MKDKKNIEALLDERRLFEPSKEFVDKANMSREDIYEEGKDIEKFWAKAADNVDWFKKWDTLLEWKPPFAKWYIGGKLNISYNCLDRHLKTRKNKAAIIWEGEPGDEKVYTYWDLYREVNKFANVLKHFGVKKGDRVTIYLPMVPELPIAMLACTRIGAVHSVVFGGFSPESLRERINDSDSKVVITADGGFRRGAIVPLKRNVDAAIEDCPCVHNVIVVKRVGEEARIHMSDGRDHWWTDLMDDSDSYCEPEQMDSEDLLYILYTSGTTGKPKGIVHTTGGYLVGTTLTAKWIFDLKDEDTYWCSADIGWVTGHSYIVYGILSNGATTVMYEGSPDYPEKDRFWEIIEKYNVNIFYTAPTAIRTFMKWGEEWTKKRDLSSLRLLGSVGEPINPEAWMWYQKNIGKGKCPVVDTWWQTETGMILISPLPGIVNTKPGSATRPFPGIEAKVFDDKGNEVPPESGGYLVLTKPWPAMLRTIYGDADRYKEQYWSKYKNIYFTGDGARKDKDGYFWLMGRVDDVINVSGHRLSTMEIESALVDHPSVAESAVIGKTHEIKGQAVAAFVTLKQGVTANKAMQDTLKEHVAKKIGSMARPEDIYFTSELPKTRSGKIMRRLLRDIAEKRALGDTTTLADPNVIESLKQQYEDEE